MVDARAYHEQTKHHPGGLGGSPEAMDPAIRPRPWKEYEDLDRVALPRIRAIEQPTLALVSERLSDPRLKGADPVTPSIDREVVATLCHAASGVTQEVETDRGEVVRFRAAACTGKLYHVDLYLAVGPGTGLPAGLYHFDPDTMGLDVLRQGDVRHAITGAVGGDDRTRAAVDEAPITVIATSHWWRNAWKYTERTYRHAFWDTGTVLANLLAAAHAHDLPASIVTGFADKPIASLIGVDPETEAPIAMVPIGDGKRVEPGPDPEAIDPATVPVSSDTNEYPLIHDAWRQSALSDGDTAADWRADVRDAIANASADGSGDRLALEPVDDRTASARPFHATIHRRGSCREYAAKGPSRRMIGTVLDRAFRGIPGDWNDGEATGPGVLEPYVLATGVPDIPDGTYRLDPGETALERVGECDSATKERLALGQQWGGDAHVNVYMMADVEDLVGRLGNRGYRLAQLEAGVTLGRLYLATYAHRVLGGTGLTFFDDPVTEHLGADDLTPMCLFAFGRAAR